MKKYHLIFCIILFLYNCKSQQPLAKEEPLSSEASYCLLKNLPFTTDYKNRIENYTSIYNDTIFEIESSKHESNDYKSVLELRASESYLWLIRVRELKVDSFLVHCISPTKSVDIEFYIDQCKIEFEEIDYNEKNGEILKMTTSPKTVKNWLSQE